MENKNRDVLMVILLIIIAVIVTFGLCYRYMVVNNKDTSVVTQTEQLSNQTVVPEVNTVAEVKTTTVIKGVFPVFDVTKGKKVVENCKYTGEIIFGTLDPTSLSSDGKVTVNSNNKTMEVQGLSGKVVDVRSGTIGDGASGYMVFLMTDGTVELSTEYYDSVNAGIIKSTGKVVGLKNIVRIEKTMSTRTAEGRTSSRATFIAIDADGNFYDIMN